MAVGLLSCPFSLLPLSMSLPFCHSHCPLISLFTICLSIGLTAKPPGRGRENKPIQLSEVQRRDISPLKHPVPLSSSLSESTHTHTHSHISSDKAMAKTDQTNKTIHSHYTQILTAKCEKCLRVGCSPGFHLDQELIKWSFEAHTYCSFHCETTQKKTL